MPRRSLICFIAVLTLCGHAFAQSPYAGQETREIKALSPQEVADLLEGRGMGFAKAAELNGYPGPLHVLELAAELQLTPEQKAETEALFQRMKARASQIGSDLVAEERQLDHQFQSKAITPDSLQASLEKVGKLQGELRQVHLDAHLEQTALLSQAQVAQYSQLRGYDAGHSGHEQHH